MSADLETRVMQRIDRREVDEWACKPNSVARRGELAIIYLGRRLLDASCDLPEASGRTTRAAEPSWMAGLRLPLGLAPDGVYIADPVTRAAGGLLHHLFTLTTDEACALSVAMSSLWH